MRMRNKPEHHSGERGCLALAESEHSRNPSTRRIRALAESGHQIYQTSPRDPNKERLSLTYILSTHVFSAS
ncbi:MAG: hypothetical protein DA443_10120 [Bacteroidetes bacterium]|nr:MAG: hypothetical protein DA443_10120 [Bacteroidota bacterium]